LLKDADEGYIHKEKDILNYCKFMDGVIQLIDHFEGEKNVYLVTGYCEYTFNRYFNGLKGIEEVHIKDFIKQVAFCIKNLHDNGIIHRDLKPDNIMLKVKSGKIIVKLIDVGLSHLVFDKKSCTGTCGSLLFLAPEIIGREYSYAVDIWSLDVLIYFLIFKQYPFNIYHSRKEFIDSLINNTLVIPVNSISKTGQNLLQRQR
jgi:serine/threonine protein kinase